MTPIPFGHFCHGSDIMILLNILTFAAKTWECYYGVMKYKTFSRKIGFKGNKTYSFYIIIQQNLTFSLNLTGDSNFFILSISTHNKLSLSGFKQDLND